ncbi:hypothetical protein [Streptomyces sp. NBC_01361]|nr:hypothetical protein [Streptomyces sp. NBC_01361]
MQLALPLRPLLRNSLEQATGNFFAAYYAGILAPSSSAPWSPRP